MRKSQQQTLANINVLVSEQKQMKLQESTALKVKKKRKLGILIWVLASRRNAIHSVMASLSPKKDPHIQ
ncbi:MULTISPECIES: hypothetical protein [unclassified Sporosarcina]|uniref:hypothetical protein n=1 Tax=unclassified Sporosarcina TaxID=2647733 RepID=UPI000C163ED8|nr:MULTISPECIES: hypothetical protein [unclassified Sporosarcina]PID05856.1 hypothetical protein CSV66_07650 [Sporosarcina sp. P30]PID09050.1 hypothetical protein CSV65_07650 [Sporosarcina sp. P31]PID12347.1 hypothetical protein CSV64_07120 [Sporosarcina sp. P32b]